MTYFINKVGLFIASRLAYSRVSGFEARKELCVFGPKRFHSHPRCDSFENDTGVDGKQDLFVCSLLLEGRSVGSRLIKVG